LEKGREASRFQEKICLKIRKSEKFQPAFFSYEETPGFAP